MVMIGHQANGQKFHLLRVTRIFSAALICLSVIAQISFKQTKKHRVIPLIPKYQLLIYSSVINMVERFSGINPLRIFRRHKHILNQSPHFCKGRPCKGVE